MVRVPCCVLQTRSPDLAGGALYAAGTAELYDCVFSNNRAVLGSAVSSVVSFVLEDSDFRGNALLCDDNRFFLDWKNNVSLEGVHTK